MTDRLSPPRQGAASGRARRHLWLAAAVGMFMIPAANAGPSVERVRGFFCNAKNDSVAFLLQKAKGENEEMAAYAVNKQIAKFSCAYYLPADAIYTGEQTVMEDGLVFKLRKYLFLPEKVERWRGSVFGSLSTQGPSRADI